MGQQFAQYYYQTFAANRSGLANLYQADSLLTYEGTEFMGQQAIMEKILVRPAHQRLNETCVCVSKLGVRWVSSLLLLLIADSGYS